MNPLVEALEILSRGQGLTADQCSGAVSVIITGQATEASLAAFLTALRVKGESADELAGAVEAVRGRMERFGRDSVQARLDTCGTGGDGARTVNVSTATAIVVASCGVPVAKHGNRSASGNSGSAEVLAELGVAIEADVAVLERCLRELGITFLFAPRFHPAMRHAAAVRKQLPFRTLFNLIGPLANPAEPACQLIGVASETQADLVAEALRRLDTQCAAVVTGADGLDEVTLDGATHVRWVENGAIRLETWTPESFGLPRIRMAELQVSGPAESAARLGELFDGKGGPVQAIVQANSAAALLVAGAASTLREGAERAGRAIASGDARTLLERWRQLSHGPS